MVDEIRSISKGYDADVCVKAVGFEPDRDLPNRARSVVNLDKGSPKVLLVCMSAARRGGYVFVPGVYATPFDTFPVGQFFDKGITLRGG